MFGESLQYCACAKVYSPSSDQWNGRVTFPPHRDNSFIAHARMRVKKEGKVEHGKKNGT